MIAVSIPIHHESAAGGLRPVNIRRDMVQVVALLRLAFGSAIEAEARGPLNPSIGGEHQPWLELFKRPGSQVTPGFVWEEGGRIVGNVSLLPTRIPGRFLVANVAVHPKYRRRGIARQLMHAVLEAAASHQGRVVLLQVDHDNQPAIDLYASLGFLSVGRMTSWEARFSRLRELPAAASGRSSDRLADRLMLRPLRRGDWRAAYELDRQCVAPDLDWPQPVQPDYYRPGFGRWFSNLLNAQQVESWVVADDDQCQLWGVATIASQWGSAHRLRLRVSRSAAGQLERPLLAKLLRRLRYMASRSVRIDHPAGDEITSALLSEANFVPRRTLATMRYDLNIN